MLDLKDLTNLMFPGEKRSGIPNFAAAAGADRPRMRNADFVQLEICLQQLEVSREDVNVSDIISHLTDLEPDLFKRFSKAAIEFYFSRAAVVEALRKKPSPLFPHQNQIEDIDYDLLEPVLEKIRTQGKKGL